MEKRKKGLERNKLMEPWKMVKNVKITSDLQKAFKIGDIQISEIMNSISIEFDKFQLERVIINSIVAPVGAPSVKPFQLYEMIEAKVPRGPYLEIFGRPYNRR